MLPGRNGNVSFSIHDLDIPCLAFSTADVGLRSKTRPFLNVSRQRKIGFQTLLSYRRPHNGLV